MRRWSLFPVSQNVSKTRRWGQRGQTFIEFMMLLVVVLIMSYSFMYVANKGIGNRWKGIVTLVKQTVPGTGTVCELDEGCEKSGW